MTDIEMRKEIKRLIKERYKTLYLASIQLDKTPSYLSMIICGKSNIPKWLIEKLGFRRIDTYEPM